MPSDPERRGVLERLRRDAARLAAHFELSIASLDAERPNVKRRYGVCFSDGAIRIRLQHATTGRPLKYSSLVNTLCHELAHLRHFNHGPRFKTLYLRILEHARVEGIYRPATRAPAGRDVPLRGRAGMPPSTRAPTAAVAAGRDATEAGRAARDRSTRATAAASGQLELFAATPAPGVRGAPRL